MSVVYVQMADTGVTNVSDPSCARHQLASGLVSDAGPEQAVVLERARKLVKAYSRLCKTHLITLFAKQDGDEGRRYLGEILQLTSPDSDLQAEIVLDFYWSNLTFAKQCRMSPEKALAFFQITASVLEQIPGGATSWTEALSLFQNRVRELTLRSNAHREVYFNDSDVENIAKFVAPSFFQHFRLYQYALTYGRDKRVTRQEVFVRTTRQPEVATPPEPAPSAPDGESHTDTEPHDVIHEREASSLALEAPPAERECLSAEANATSALESTDSPLTLQVPTDPQLAISDSNLDVDPAPELQPTTIEPSPAEQMAALKIAEALEAQYGNTVEGVPVKSIQVVVQELVHDEVNRLRDALQQRESDLAQRLSELELKVAAEVEALESSKHSKGKKK